MLELERGKTSRIFMFIKKNTGYNLITVLKSEKSSKMNDMNFEVNLLYLNYFLTQSFSTQ